MVGSSATVKGERSRAVLPSARPSGRQGERWVALTLFLLFAAALAFRLWGIFNPLLDFHAWRQAQTAMVARNFFRDGMNLFAPRLDVLNPFFEFEFQVYPYLVALLYQPFGVREWLGRLTAVLFSLGAMGYLYALGRRYLDRRAALVAAFLFAVLPMAVYYSRTFMPESTMLFFAVAGIYHFGRWLDRGRERDYWLAAAGICGAVLVKLPSLYLFLPLAFLAWEKRGPRAFWTLRSWVFGLLVLVPAVLWYGYTNAQAQALSPGPNIWLQNDKLFGLDEVLSPRFYRLLFLTRLGEKMFAFSAFPLLLVGLVLPVRRREEYALHVWFGSVILYFFVVARGNAIHEYYQLPVIPVGSLFVGKTISAAVARARKKGVPLKKDRACWLLAALLLFVPLHSVYKVHKRLRTDPSALRFGRKVASLTPAEAVLLVQDSHQTDLLYYADRRGWHVPIYYTGPGGVRTPGLPEMGEWEVESYREKGCRYYVARIPDFRHRNPHLYGYFRENYPILEEGRDGIIVDLGLSLQAMGREQAER